jgi:hypothetical protein
VNWIKVGKDAINQPGSRAYDLLPARQRPRRQISVYFSDDSDGTLHYHGIQAERIQHYLDTIACDLDQAEAIAAAAKAPTHDALVADGLLPPTGAQVWNAAQDAFRRISNAVSYMPAFEKEYYAVLEVIEQEAAALPGTPSAAVTQVTPVTSREISTDEFSQMLATAVADGHAAYDWEGED